ncbi:hypothetical protein GII30_10085 [Gordonia amarae]|uniref:NRDE family protein n=2 Tax=Gordonia amarae TaxID=36821 RepID=G7GVM9_9ACTN|nr:NRDE family protein [Gordonia amarae]MCS3878732.1 uncharacterized protein with NRDE domain [Gordonia amarae]QHN17314.1 hypothetical protein GII35_10310 [Gordonia amarae]QHN21840.1 hypothetical protein GII34_10090 [Gordonia amarae]QHN30690.1 hypothetical protein GII32_10100 [Gordonia amarae]QHN39466.1 hypothetical protein GII30_10085 [Gordonia amarae]
MCLIVFAVNVIDGFPLVVAANRDEFYARETVPVHRWADLPVIGGRDAVAGGTWMGVSAEVPGRFAAVTNVRDGDPVPEPDKRSRGALPVDFLTSGISPADEARRLTDTAAEYAPVNLVVSDGDSVWWAANRPEIAAQRVADGVHGLSNGALDNSWPKVARTVEAVTAALRTAPPQTTAADEALFAVLADDRPAPDDLLPDTGVGIGRERDLSPAFIRTPGYGTRTSSVLWMRADGHGILTERRFDEGTYLDQSTVEW